MSRETQTLHIKFEVGLRHTSNNGHVSGSHPDTTNTTANQFVKVYPNPAKELLNLAYYATTNGQVVFELRNQLGQVVLSNQLGGEQFIAQFSTQSLSSGLYYWQLKDSQRVIKAGKVVIIQ